jgi:hypothetical protein
MHRATAAPTICAWPSKRTIYLEVSGSWICGCIIKICTWAAAVLSIYTYFVEFVYTLSEWNHLPLFNQTHPYYAIDSLKVTNKAHSRCCESHANLEGPPKLELREQKLQSTPAAKASGAQAKQHPAHIKVPHPHPEDRILFMAVTWLTLREEHGRLYLWCECFD